MSTPNDDPPPASLVTTDEREAVSRAREVLRSTTPGTDMTAVFELDVDSGQREQARRLLVAGVEELTGLRLGELQTLTAVAEGADHHRTVARLTGQADAAAAATVAGLVDRGMLARHHHPKEQNPAAEPTLVHITPKGEAVLVQSEAIRFRLLDTVAQTFSGPELEHMRVAADTLRVGTGEQLRRQIGGTAAAS